MDNHSSFEEDILEAKRLFSGFDTATNLIEFKHRARFYDLIKRYEEAKGSGIQRGISKIASFSKTTFRVIHDGYESSYSVDYPLELLTDPDFILRVEEKRQLKIKEQSDFYKAQEKKKFLELKAKYENL